MLHNAEQKMGGGRKFCLFGVACCRRHWSALLPESQQLLVEYEQLLDQGLDQPELHRECSSLCHRANEAVGRVASGDTRIAKKLRVAAAKAVCYTVIGCPWGYGYFQELDRGETPHQVSLLRDIFGNPFRPVPFDPAWRTDVVQAIAQEMYEACAFTLLPILADALEDVGCRNADILAHLRGPGGHTRGCWVIDHLLGKS
jgi:hypothetical protein